MRHRTINCKSLTNANGCRVRGKVASAIQLYDGRNRIALGGDGGSATGGMGADVATFDLDFPIFWVRLNGAGSRLGQARVR